MWRLIIITLGGGESSLLIIWRNCPWSKKTNQSSAISYLLVQSTSSFCWCGKAKSLIFTPSSQLWRIIPAPNLGTALITWHHDSFYGIFFYDFPWKCMHDLSLILERWNKEWHWKFKNGIVLLSQMYFSYFSQNDMEDKT